MTGASFEALGEVEARVLAMIIALGLQFPSSAVVVLFNEQRRKLQGVYTVMVDLVITPQPSDIPSTVADDSVARDLYILGLLYTYVYGGQASIDYRTELSKLSIEAQDLQITAITPTAVFDPSASPTTNPGGEIIGSDPLRKIWGLRVRDFSIMIALLGFALIIAGVVGIYFFVRHYTKHSKEIINLSHWVDIGSVGSVKTNYTIHDDLTNSDGDSEEGGNKGDKGYPHDKYGDSGDPTTPYFPHHTRKEQQTRGVDSPLPLEIRAPEPVSVRDKDEKKKSNTFRLSAFFPQAPNSSLDGENFSRHISPAQSNSNQSLSIVVGHELRETNSGNSTPTMTSP
jgi:hypothetical protein